LQLACEAWDRAQEARAAIALEGLTINTPKGGMRPHPAIKIENDSQIRFARFVRELDLDTEPPPDSRVGPPALRSNRG
jgi:phage terminase small subunit